MLSSLVDLCLNSVVKNLERHNLLFTTSDDFDTKRKLEFLQKKYSLSLVSRLNAKGDGLPEEFLDLVVNRHNKFLDTRWFKKCPLTKLTSKLTDIGSSLEKIFCNHEFAKDEFIEAIKDSICYLINLKSFTLHFKSDDSMLKNIGKFCRHIEEIDVKKSPITSDGVRFLCRGKDGKVFCTSLKKVCFGGEKYIKYGDVKYLLQNVPSLEVIDYPKLPLVLYSLHGYNLSSLDKVVPYNITTLDLTEIVTDPYFTNVVKVCASVCPRLKNFSCVVGKEGQLRCLFNIPDLENLRMSGNKKINIDSYLTSKGSQLASLNIQGCTVSVPVLAEKCPRLKELILHRANILCDEDSKPMFHSLSSLTFIGYPYTINDDGIELMLSSLIKLQYLSFKNCGLESAELKVAILKCCESCLVKNIAFDKSDIEKEFMENLLSICHTLHDLTLNNCECSFEEEDLLDFVELMPNKPKISITTERDSEESDYDDNSDSKKSDSDDNSDSEGSDSDGNERSDSDDNEGSDSDDNEESYSDNNDGSDSDESNYDDDSHFD